MAAAGIYWKVWRLLCLILVLGRPITNPPITCCYRGIFLS
ncbi:hypothetical protein EVA_02496 [gut metagenome]|uniref:Uncharacterized protein n=1 Tax=gut metagenome TaxID=749906 RepID=J9GNX8_9ZZZZ